MVDTSELYFVLLKELLTSPMGFLLIALLGVGMVVLALYPRTRWLAIAAALYVSTLPTTGREGRISDFHLAFPMEQLRVYARPLTALFLMVLLPVLLLSSHGWRRRLALAGGWFFVLFQYGTVVRLMTDSGFLRATMVGASITLLVLVILLGASMWLQTLDDVKRLFKCVALAVGGVALGTYYQLGVDSSRIMAGSRLIGVTGNPQFLAVILAITLPIGFYLAFHSGIPRIQRICVLILLPLVALLLIWTGSRTGALSATVALLAMYWRNMGRMTLVAAFMFIGVLTIATFYEDSLNVASRLISTEDTRSGTWAAQYANFLANPLFGGSSGNVTVVENSYLSILGQFGIVGAIPFILAIILLVASVVGLHRRRRLLLPDERWITDAITGVWASMAVAAVFEGFLAGVFTFPILVLYLMLSATSFLSDYQSRLSAVEEPSWDAGLPVHAYPR